MKKIIFDISILGKGHLEKIHRTGIYRATEEIFLHLLNTPQIDLYFIASQLNILECKKYLQDNAFGKQIEEKLLIFNPGANLNNRIFYALYQQLERFSQIFPKFKLLRKLINHYGILLHYLRAKIEFIKNLNAYHVYISPYNMLPMQICGSKIKIIFIVHDLIPLVLPESTSVFARFLQMSLIKHLPRNAWVICNSRTTKRDLLQYRNDFDATRVKVIHFGTSKIFQPTPQQAFSCSKLVLPDYVKKYVLAVSSLNPRKNFLHIIDSFLSCIKTHHIEDLYLVIVGPNGWEYEAIFHKLENIGNYKNKIIMTGYIEDEYLPHLYSKSLCFTMMSLYEGFGFPVLEAMKCGAPVIVSDNSSLSEIVEEAGIQLPPKDQTALVEAIYQIYSSPSLQQQMSANSLKQAQQFSWLSFINELTLIF